MNIAFCYESVLPYRGGCETYISGLARRLAGDGHEVHLYACRWDEAALPAGIRYHALPLPRGPRFWRHYQAGGLGAWWLGRMVLLKWRRYRRHNLRRKARQRSKG